jgi:hypothetical protein
VALVQVLDKPRLDRPPPEQLSGQRAGCRLVDRGVPERAASLAAETGVAVFKVAFARWISEPVTRT